MATPETTLASTVMRDARLELPPSLPDYLDDIERDVIRQALVRTYFNRTKAADCWTSVSVNCVIGCNDC